jgi:hypothetical protein
MTAPVIAMRRMTPPSTTKSPFCSACDARPVRGIPGFAETTAFRYGSLQAPCISIMAARARGLDAGR